MNDLSPKAQKAVAAGEQRRRAYWPTLNRTETLLILERPHRFRKGGRKAFADYVYKELPLFGFNSKRNYWEAPLTWEAYSQIVDKFTQAKELQVRLSDEVKIWADCAGAAERARERYAEAGGQEEYCRQKNAAHYRRKAAGYRPGSPLHRYYMDLARERMTAEQRQEQRDKDEEDLYGSSFCSNRKERKLK